MTPERAADLLSDGQPVKDSYIGGELKIESDAWTKEVVLENCIVENFSGSVTQFEKSVKLINCYFKKCSFTFTYFLGGMTIDNCSFDSYLDFQAGGHNKTNIVTITNNEFRNFVNFFDCWYNSEVIITNNKFHKGTNLLGKAHNLTVTFDVCPLIMGNFGQLDINSEGEMEIN